MEKICKLLYQSACYELFYGHFRKPLYVHSVPRHEMSKTLYLLCQAFRVRTNEGLHAVFIVNLCVCAAYRTPTRYLHAVASCQILRNLRNNHICLIYLYPIAYSQSELSHNADVMHRSSADGGSFQFNRLKNSHRIYQPRSGCTPFYFFESCFFDFISPFKGN